MITTLNQKIKENFSKHLKKRIPVDEQKSHLRYKVSKLKQTTSEEYRRSRSKLVFEKIEKYPEFQEAKIVLMYWSLSDELPTHDFIKKWSKSKTILLPVVKNKQMTIRPFVSEDKLSAGDLRVMEPKFGKDYLKDIDLAIIPGVAFDRKKRRLGRGKAYYDRYLKGKRVKKWGICCDYQLFDKVPTTRKDIKMDRVITPTETVW